MATAKEDALRCESPKRSEDLDSTTNKEVGDNKAENSGSTEPQQILAALVWPHFR